MGDGSHDRASLDRLLAEGLVSREEYAALSGEARSRQWIGAYQVKGPIARGPTSSVWRARHRAPGMAERQGGDVAVKLLEGAADPATLSRFQSEAELAQRLNHPGIVKVHELVFDGGEVAIVMQHVEGQTLAAMLDSLARPFSWQQVLGLVSQVLQPLRHAHEQRTVHRNLKPENLMLGRDGRLRILDFGIAKDVSVDYTVVGARMGTLTHSAPEQFDGRPVDHRADLYAVGIVLYEMLTGRLPWDKGASRQDILASKLQGQLPSLVNFAPDVPRGLVDIVERLLEIDPERRMGSVLALQRALQTFAVSNGLSIVFAPDADGPAADEPDPAPSPASQPGVILAFGSIPRSFPGQCPFCEERPWDRRLTVRGPDTASPAPDSTDEGPHEMRLPICSTCFNSRAPRNGRRFFARGLAVGFGWGLGFFGAVFGEANAGDPGPGILGGLLLGLLVFWATFAATKKPAAVRQDDRIRFLGGRSGRRWFVRAQGSYAKDLQEMNDGIVMEAD